MTEEKQNFLLRAAEIEERADSFSHPWNPDSLVNGTRMSKLAGLERVDVNKAFIGQGSISTPNGFASAES